MGERSFVTFVNPTAENGVHVFARIAEEMACRRPDVKFLVIEAEGTEETLAGCGLELKDLGTISLMEKPEDPGHYWSSSRVCLAPSPRRGANEEVVLQALARGVPTLVSERLGDLAASGGVPSILPVPERLTAGSPGLPTPGEVARWVDALIGAWDAERPDPALASCTVLVPHLDGIRWECEQSLRGLERVGVRVVRSGGSSQIDVARNRMASDALHDGAGSILFIDSDIGFEPTDALRLIASPEPVISAVYAKKGRREFASSFSEGIGDVLFGGHAPAPYPLKYAATGFPRIKASVLREMIEKLALPLCDTRWGRGHWPFFMPMVVPQGPGRAHYLGEDWAFSHRLSLIGVTPMADTSIRLWHYGNYAYGWEDAGWDMNRSKDYSYKLINTNE